MKLKSLGGQYLSHKILQEWIRAIGSRISLSRAFGNRKEWLLEDIIQNVSLPSWARYTVVLKPYNIRRGRKVDSTWMDLEKLAELGPKAVYYDD